MANTKLTLASGATALGSVTAQTSLAPKLAHYNFLEDESVCPTQAIPAAEPTSTLPIPSSLLLVPIASSYGNGYSGDTHRSNTFLSLFQLACIFNRTENS